MALSFGEKIKSARKLKKLTQKQLAKEIGAAHNSVSDWENDKNKPDPDTIELLCGVLEISPNYLLASSSDDFSPSEKLLIKKYRSLDDHGKETVQMILDRESERTKIVKQQAERIVELETKPNNTSDAGMHPYPYLHRIACAGTSFAFEDIPTEQKLVPYMPGADFVIGVLGDSMEPTFFDGELVYVRKTDHIRHGDIGIFTLGNEWYIKECGEFGLLSHNPDYDDIPGSEYIRVVGEVLGKVPNEYV